MVKVQKHIVLIFVFIVISAFDLYSSNLKFYSINAMYGISMREANSVCKDDNGFIWASSKAGILRLTDDDYRLYQLPYETANILTVKLVYKNSLLLAYTNNGQIFYYNVLSDRFDLLENLRTVLKSNFLSVTSLVIEGDSYWIASSYGLYKYQNGEFTFVGDDKSTVQSVATDNKNHIFVARGSGIWQVDCSTLTSKCLVRNTSMPSFDVSKIYYDNTLNRLWIGTISSGLFYYDFNSGLFSNLQSNTLPKQPILAIETNSESSVLIGIDGQGIWELSRRGDRLLNVYKESGDDQSSLRGNGIYDIFCDQNKRVWICSYSGGVSYFDLASPLVNQITHQTNNPNSLVNNSVNSILEDGRGQIWFATDNGISCLDKTTNNWRNFYNNKQEQAQVFLTLCRDNSGRIWAGSYSSGVYVIDEKTGRELAHYSEQDKNSPVQNDFVFDIFKDSQGDLWIGGVNSEVICYRSRENDFKSYPYQPLNAFEELSPNKMLMGCTYGLVLLDKLTGETKILLDGCLIHDILVVKGEVWIGTSGEGLIRFDPQSGKTEHFTTQSGLSSNFINSIAYADDYLWLGTENGLCRFNPNDKSVLIYSSIFSLSRVSFNRNAQNILRNGQLAFGTNGGAVFFDPGAIQQIQTNGKIFFQDLTISGRSIRESTNFKLDEPLDSLHTITLKYNQNTLSLELIPVGVGAGSKFSWKMEGLDDEWRQPSDHRFVTYTNIPSKDFTLKIRLYDSSLSQIIAERTLKINMIPPFWKTWWFLVLMFMSVTSVLYLYFWYYIGKLKQQHSDDKINFFANTTHDIRTLLTLISAPVEELKKEKSLSEKGNYYLRLALDQTRRLSTIATQLLDFQKMDVGKGQLSLKMVDIVNLVSIRKMMFDSLANKKNVELCFSSDKASCITAVDESMIEKVIDNLISNAVKYSHTDSKVHIQLNFNKNSWELVVEDSGIGMSKKAQNQLFKEFYRGENAVNSKVVGSGIGLMVVKNYVNMHDGQITYTSQENIGSTFRVVIPLKEVASKIDSSEAAKQKYSSSEDVVISPLIPNSELDKKPMSILVVEDNDDLRNFMQYPLREEFEVFLAEDGVKAWEMIQTQMPDLVVSDVMMPNMDGFELCELIKSTYETSHIPVVLLTALSEKAEQLRGLGLGADDYLTKPFDMTLLILRIKSIIQRQILVREKALNLSPVNFDEPILENKLNDKFVKKAMEVVHANISNASFDKDTFASEMNVSSSLLYKKIKSLTNQSPVDFIKDIRLNYALKLLQKKNYSVTEVSELSGFSSIGYFSTVFKKHFGKSPTEIE